MSQDCSAGWRTRLSKLSGLRALGEGTSKSALAQYNQLRPWRLKGCGSAAEGSLRRRSESAHCSVRRTRRRRGRQLLGPGQYGSFAAIAPRPAGRCRSSSTTMEARSAAISSLPGPSPAGGSNGSFDGYSSCRLIRSDDSPWSCPELLDGVYPGLQRRLGKCRIGAAVVIPLGTSLGRQRPLSDGAALLEQGRVNNFMAYLSGDIPVGSYNPDRLANLGIGHGAIDVGGAYTYLNAKTGTDSRRLSGSPATSRTLRPIIPTESIRTSISLQRSS